nr:hypothetical protein BaRGS_030176 [Batillaria attramentaria]
MAGHVCKIDYGLEPDYIDNDECAYYWSCEDYWGTLQRCHGTDQFHFQYHMCMNDDDVSCYVQMEKYDHGHNYDHIDESYSRSKTCEISHGLEPNMYDEGCKSFWSCEDHQGTLHECPTGFQFDWEYLDCMLDKEVICEKQMEWFYQYVYHDTVHPHPEEGEEGGWKGGDGEWSSWSGSDSGTYDYPRVYHGEGSQGSVEHMNRMRRHRCEVRYGREPDYASPICASYWLCDDHHGNLQHCPHGYLFHWYQMECLREEDVDCRRQREGEDDDDDDDDDETRYHL